MKLENSVWGEKEYEHFEKLQALQIETKFNVVEFERTVDNLKRCVTEHLWQVTVEEAQLIQQLKLIKDFYLMGRGDLFLEFIRLTTHVLNKTPTSHTSRDINFAFQTALRKLQPADESSIDSFIFSVAKPLIETGAESAGNIADNFKKERDDPIGKKT